MSLEKLNKFCSLRLDDIKKRGVEKGAENIIREIILPKWVSEGRQPDNTEDQSKGVRYILMDTEQEFLLMNSNSYLGLSFHPDVISADEAGVKKFGTGPGAVRFISGTYSAHRDLEQQLARFHSRDAAMIFSSAYSTVMGVIPSLIDKTTLVISDELNHNCIINALRLSRPGAKEIYRHLDMDDLNRILDKYSSGRLSPDYSEIKRVIVVTDGIFSMRGDYAPLDRISEVCQRYEDSFEEGIVTITDDSHGVGAFGGTGRGTEEYTNTRVDILIGTLGKAFGVNGGYIVADHPVINFLRETSPFYVYSNPVSPAEAMAALKSVEIVNSSEGLKRLEKIRLLTTKFRKGLKDLGFESIPGVHPVIPLLVRDTRKTTDLVNYLYNNAILATGLNYPVVPEGSQEIRFQINANHTTRDIEYTLDILKTFH